MSYGDQYGITGEGSIDHDVYFESFEMHTCSDTTLTRREAVLSESMAVLLAVQWQSIDSTELSRSHVCLIQSIKYNYAIGYP